MRFSYAESMTEPSFYAPLARAAEEAGYDSMVVPDSIISAEAYTVDGVRRLAEASVTDLIVGFRWPYVTGPDTEPLVHKLASLRRFADTVIARV